MSREDAEATAAAVQAAVSFFTRRARESKKSELSLPERSLLSRLHRNGPDTTANLARWEEITPQSVGRTVSALEARNLLTRAPDPQDGRRSILTVTPEGVAFIQAGRGATNSRLTVTLEKHFTSEEMAQIRSAASLIERLAELN